MPYYHGEVALPSPPLYSLRDRGRKSARGTRTRTYTYADFEQLLCTTETNILTRWLMENYDSLYHFLSEDERWSLMVSRARLGLSHVRLIFPCVAVYPYRQNPVTGEAFDWEDRLAEMIALPDLDEESLVRMLRYTWNAATLFRFAPALHVHSSYAGVLRELELTMRSPGTGRTPFQTAAVARRMARIGYSEQHLQVLRPLIETWTGTPEELVATVDGILS